MTCSTVQFYLYISKSQQQSPEGHKKSVKLDSVNDFTFVKRRSRSYQIVPNNHPEKGLSLVCQRDVCESRATTKHKLFNMFFFICSKFDFITFQVYAYRGMWGDIFISCTQSHVNVWAPLIILIFFLHKSLFVWISNFISIYHTGDTRNDI